MKKQYAAFTLVEILIVMGILLILVAVGITAGRYAILRANRIEHQAAAEELYETALRFKNDNGYYPRIGSCSSCIEEQFFAEALGYKGAKNFLEGYLEQTPFNGGTNATYYYYVEPIQAQFIIVCVSLGGIDDESNYGYFCTGDGLGFLPESDPLIGKEIGSEEDDPHSVSIIRSFDGSDWEKDIGFAGGR